MNTVVAKIQSQGCKVAWFISQHLNVQTMDGFQNTYETIESKSAIHSPHSCLVKDYVLSWFVVLYTFVTLDVAGVH